MNCIFLGVGISVVWTVLVGIKAGIISLLARLSSLWRSDLVRLNRGVLVSFSLGTFRGKSGSFVFWRYFICFLGCSIILPFPSVFNVKTVSSSDEIESGIRVGTD